MIRHGVPAIYFNDHVRIIEVRVDCLLNPLVAQSRFELESEIL
jgi:hypothetical protein